MLDKRYKAMKLDLISDKEDNLLMKFSLSDNQTSDFYINITRDDSKINLSDYKTTLYIETPNKEILKKELTEYDETSNLYYCNLETEYKNEIGEYHCQIMIEDKYTSERIIPLNNFKYKVFDDNISKGGSTPDIPSGGATIDYDPVTGNLTIRSNSLDYNSQSGNLKI